MKDTLNPKDFRLGNYLESYSGDKYFQITVDDFIIIANDESKAKPIPLTEEWLLKFGYDLISENHYAVLGHLVWSIEDRFYCDKNGIQLKHVHQLQNLYFVLTGEELTITT